MIDSGALTLSKCAIALKGTGVGAAAVVDVEELPPLLAVAEVDRDVPLVEVVALDDVLSDPLAVESVLLPEVLVALVASVEVEFTLEVAELVVLALESAEVVADPDVTPVVEEGVSNALPVDAADPEPAPDDDPAVLEAPDEEDELVEDDWM